MHKHKIITPATRPSRKGPAISVWLTAIARQHADFELINERGEFAPEAISQKARSWPATKPLL